ncbi:hypothetical protein [Miltoncostaea oceani]|uniref:hypothetical protein n=1 Tax=Miltoncostaea oceani TaxID=2843216 RepID=UPI0024847B0D|nr:hypothetical protein [Miltoncostaea oceani]
MGAPGGLDRGFDGDGLRSYDLGTAGSSSDVAVQPDGKVVMLSSVSGAATDGDLLITRVLADGNPDLTFGTGGSTRIAPAGTQFPTALALAPDGRIVILGFDSGLTASILVARLTADGALDPSFGAGSGVRTITAAGGIPSDVAVQADGRIVLTGSARPVSEQDILVMRLNADGSTDAGFGAGGTVFIEVLRQDIGNRIAIAPDGRIVIAGASSGASGNIVVVRLDAAGNLDASFDGDGRFVSTLPENDSARALVVQPDGRIVIAGSQGIAGKRFPLIVRLTDAGAADPTFGQAGFMLVRRASDATGNFDELVIQPDGALIATGSTIARLTPEGAVDLAFGNAGQARIPSGISGRAPVTLAPDGDLVMAATTSTVAAGSVLLARYEGGGTLRPARCAGRIATFVGTNAGENRMRGTEGDDVIMGLGGNDTISGLGGNDVVCAGPGRDKVLGNAGNDRLFGEAGPDRLLGGPGNDRLSGGPGRDHLSGEDGVDRLLGGPGPDLLLGGSAGDILDGLAGRDEARGGDGRDVCRAEVVRQCP